MERDAGTLADGTKVHPRMYYYLLDFNEATGREFINSEFDKNRLMDLNKIQFKILFEHACKEDSSTIVL